MQKIRPAMERLNAALDRLEEHQKKSAATTGGEIVGKQAEVDALAMQCAHLRAEVSGLKKKKAELEAIQTRAGVQIDKAMRQIDDVLGGV
tara:strand:- start:762 stop:1031 length:270 start_codon:yes stop_codon:yes gene_type:complete